MPRPPATAAPAAADDLGRLYQLVAAKPLPRNLTQEQQWLLIERLVR